MKIENKIEIRNLSMFIMKSFEISRNYIVVFIFKNICYLYYLPWSSTLDSVDTMIKSIVCIISLGLVQ